MPTAARTQHRTVENTALPYISNSSITSTSPQYITGSLNILTGLQEWLEKFPGFSASIEPSPTAFVNLQRQFLWRRWVSSSPNGGAFIWMGCDVSGGVAKVYKMQIGTDGQAQLLFTSTSSEPFDFVVSGNTLYFGNGTDMKKWNSQTLSNWGIVAPAAAPGISLVAGASNVYTSWCYCCTYYNSATGHESSPSAISACSGVFANKTVNLLLTASIDSQVTGIRVYRTPDGGAQDPTEMQEIANSPFPNVTGTVSDSTPDTSLSIRVAPAFLRNDPPTPCKGFVTYGARIWGFLNNTTFYSGNEEIANGVPEECWPSGLDGNNYPWADEVFAHAPLIDGIAVLGAERISKIEGDSLDTFRRYTLLERRGTRSRTAVCALGGSVAWLDTSNTIWVSDLGEIGIPIRPDIQTINPETCWIVPHISGIYHWIVVLDGSNGILYIYDLDRRIWQCPRDVGFSASAMFSGETSVGNVELMLARNNTKALKLVPGTYTDDGNTYQSVAMTNMYRLTPEGNPAWKGVHDWSEIKTDTNPPDQVFQLTDDSPSQGTFVDITVNAEPSPSITQGTYLQTWRYTSNNPTAQFLAMKFVWNAENLNFHLYQFDEALHQFGE